MRLIGLSVSLAGLLAATGTVAAGQAGAFSHLSPANGAIVKSTSVLLTWGAGFSSSSEYCIDPVNNNACDTGWVTLPISQRDKVVVSGLSPDTTYYWQVRNSGIYAEGDPAAYWSFTTTGSRHVVSALGGLSDYPSHKALSINAGGAVVGSAFGGSASGGPPSLAERFSPASEIYRLPVSPFDSATEALRNNDAGLISGYGTRDSLAAVYAGAGNWLPLLPGSVSQLGGYANNVGEVVGTTFFPGPTDTSGHATLWLPGGGGYSAVDLGLFNGRTLEPRGLAPNLSGSNRIIVGRYEPRSDLPGRFRAVQRKDDVWSELSGCFDSAANDVSDDGIVVGIACNGAALWKNGQIRFLLRECLAVSGFEFGEARGIAVTPGGRILIVGTCGNQPAIWYSDGPDSYICELLQLLPGDTQGDAFDVNASGQIVGSTKSAFGATHAAMWTFSEPSPVLTITKTGTGVGTVTSTPTGIACGIDCSLLFPPNQAVVLTATPAAGSVFSGFAGDADCHDGQVTMFAARNCTATFILGSGGGPISPLYLLWETLDYRSEPTISVLQGPTITNSWPTFAATDSRDRGYELALAVTDVVKTAGQRNDFANAPNFFGQYTASYSLSGEALGTTLTQQSRIAQDTPLDGATDGTNHYAVAVNKAQLFRFDANWDNVQIIGLTGQVGNRGIAYDPSTNSLWVSRSVQGISVVWNYSLTGELLGSFEEPGLGLGGALALDPADSTLWLAQRGQPGILRQYSKQGQWLGEISLPGVGWILGAEFSRPPATPGAFYKVSPTNWASGQSSGAMLSWSPSAGAIGYDYCIDTTDDNTCNSWINVGTNTSVASGDLMADTTYFWQVRAIHAGGPSYADGASSRFWKFTTEVPAPVAFGKSLPADGVTAVPLSTVLSWQPVAGATSYAYCIDRFNNAACDGFWVAVGNATSVEVVGLPASTTHYWQVRATDAGGATYADGSSTAFWSFRTGVPVPAFGQVDTPAQNAAGVQGSLSVTGWALDDVGVTGVRIYRTCLPFEAGACQTVLGNSVMYVGDAAFVEGARPDVAAAYPTYPNNAAAGWGFEVLTPMLPHVPKQLTVGGQGSVTLYAVATDSTGNQTLLGRAAHPEDDGFAAPTTISMTNDGLAKPFGAIDTPAPGETVSGVLNNFGWALTPDSNTLGGEGNDILIPTSGSTMTVFIDALPVALVAYSQCRGSVGNPVPIGLYCDDDVANVFGNLTPQTTLTPRLGNPTRFRNLDAGRAAIGAYTFDTTTLADGLHTIAWSVVDSQGRIEGIGSRFFRVANGAVSSTVMTAERSQSLGGAARLSEHSTMTKGVWGRTGFDLSAPWIPMHASDDGTFGVRLPELGRLELWLGGEVEAGYLVTNGTLQPLPVGASLSGSLFGWMPPAGYTGPYQLVFVREGARTDVTVTIVERPRVASGRAQIRMHLDPVVPERGVAGWAFDPHAAIGSGITAVHVWATPLNGQNAAPFFLGAAVLDQSRPELVGTVAGAPGNAGFSLAVSLKPGAYSLTAYAWNERTSRWEDARSVTAMVK